MSLKIDDKSKNKINEFRYHIAEIDSSGKRKPIENKRVNDCAIITDLKHNTNYELEIYSKTYYRKNIRIIPEKTLKWN